MRRLLINLLLLLLTLALAGAVTWSWLQPRTVTGALSLPEGRNVIRSGQEVPISAVANGSALRVELWVDGRPGPSAVNPAPRASAWSVTLSWQAGEPGRRTLFARFYTAGGTVVDSPPQTIDVVPDGLLAFASNRGGDYAVYTMRTDGSELRKAVEGAREPVWGPEGSLIYTSRGTLWQQSEDGKMTELLPVDFNAHAPAWRQRLAFATDSSGRERAAVRDVNGSVAALPGFDEDAFTYVGDPAWSPDGNELIVAAETRGNTDLYRLSLVDGRITRLTDDAGRDWQPAWSPDGRALLFTSDRSGHPQVYWMPLAGPLRAPQAVTVHARGAEQAAWGPDGTWFVYVAYAGLGPGIEARELFLQRLADGFTVRLTNDATDDTEPVWQPPAADLVVVPDDGFLGEFFANRTLTPPVAATQMAARLDFDWGAFAPLPGLPAEGFSARWRGRFPISAPGDYRFTLVADDGARVWVDDTLALDGWYTHDGQPSTAPVYLAAGLHLIRVEYYNDRGPARLLVTWEPAG